MLRSLSQRLTYANVMATAALFIALGGASYAATQLPANSVGNRQLKARSITRNKLDTRFLATLQPATASSSLAGPAGPQGEIGPRGPAGTNGANGVNGTNGTDGADLTTHTNLPSGQSMSGVFGLGGGTSDYALVPISFTQPLAAALDYQHVIYTTSAVTHCPGYGHADPGYLCVYAETVANATFIQIFDPRQSSAGANRYGAVLHYFTSATYAYADGTWTVTAL